MQALQPLAVEPIGFRSSRGALGLPGVDQEDLDTARLQEFKQGNPVDPGGFHGHRGDTAVEKPVGEGLEVSGEGAEPADRLGARSGGTATQCSASPMSMPAAWGLYSGRGRVSTVGSGTGGGGGQGSGKASL